VTHCQLWYGLRAKGFVKGIGTLKTQDWKWRPRDMIYDPSDPSVD